MTTDDFRQKIEDSQSGFEKLIGSIPGYKGYKERELRREADRLLRTHLANRFDEQRRRLASVMSLVTSGKRLAELAALERAILKLQLLIDRLRTTAYGYAGLFDAVKVQQAELDALYEFDSRLTEAVERTAEIISALEKQATQGESTAAETNVLLSVLQEFNDTLGRRTEVIVR